MLARMLTGEIENLQFTRVVLGDGENKNPEEATEVMSPICEAAIESIELSNNNVLSITAAFTNEDMETGFYMREKGLYLSDGNEEVLAIYANAGSTASYIEPAASGLIKKVIRSSIVFSQADIVNVTLMDSGYANAIDFNNHIKDKTIHFTKEDITNVATLELDKTADLDTLMDKNFTSYYCSGSNTVSNNPEAGKAFGLFVYRSATGYITQELLSQTGKKYIRFHNSNEWSDWKMVLYASNIMANLATTVAGYPLDATMGKQLQDNKVDKVSGKGLSTNDYTTAEKDKLAGIAAGANKTTVDSALSSSSTNPVQNKIITEQINQLLGLIATQLGSSMKWKNATSCYMNGELGACYYICMSEADTTSNVGKEVLVVYNNGAIAKGKIVKSGSNYGLENPVTFLTDTTLPLVDKTAIQGGTNTLPYSNNGSIGYCVAPGYGYGAVLEISKSNTYATKYLILN